MSGVRRRRDAGSVSLELIGMLPVLALLVALTFEVAATLWTVSATNQAVRTAARSYSLTDSTGEARAAAAGSLPGAMRIRSLSTYGAPGAGVRLEVDVPGLSVLPDRTVTRELLLP